MDVITFFEDLTIRWNTEEKCGFCWSFGAPLSESGMNATVKSETDLCCTHLFITEYEISSGQEKNPITKEINKSWCDHIFTLYVVQQSNLGINTYNEQIGFPINQSLWKTILQPLQHCLGCGKEFELCEMGYSFEILSWKMKKVHLKDDYNYTGWRILGVFRQYIV
ncbi:hypothetical protein D1632_10745 [Chryseobacterium nematophagum]|uniref:Uncharacterized protein n=1 Tax=Chryseobacterium nematophagum TaxID=2305228 RepID=A0A3M7LBB4_9FLAO|nr:hypothetical protein [Chryseobacterium nematophagum]RMZ60058.1 hypothetical protein D1632_10745 [Chryseobacterium nematophagum]